MNPRFALFFKILAAILFIGLLAAIFPEVLKFVEMGARELRYLWWLVLLAALAIWLIWGFGRKPK